jgi:secreted trypsin-like serine protease
VRSAPLAILLALVVAGSADARSRVLGGSDVAQGALPFMAAVFWQTATQSYICTGTVIAPDAVLTADHCAFDPETKQPVPASAYTVFTKTTSIDTLDPGAERRAVTSVHTFATLADASFHGDVAVLTLSSPTTAPPVQLATPTDVALYAENSPVTIAGWGVTALKGSPSTRLEEGTEALKATWDCANQIRGFVAAVDLCAESPDLHTATCNGDSGGPLLASTPSGMVEVGVISRSQGTDCGTGLDFYARVSTLQPWIASVAAGASPAQIASPPLKPPAAVDIRRTKRGLLVTFSDVAADPATLLSSFSVYLKDKSGRIIRRNNQTYSHSVTFPLPRPGTYRATVTADYTTGKSTGTVSPPFRVPA